MSVQQIRWIRSPHSNTSKQPAPWRAPILVRETAYLDVEDRIAIDTELCAVPEALDGIGDDRTRDQIMADVLFERVTGRTAADGAPITVNLVMSEAALLGDSDEAAHIEGYGPIPADNGQGLCEECNYAKQALSNPEPSPSRLEPQLSQPGTSRPLPHSRIESRLTELVAA